MKKIHLGYTGLHNPLTKVYIVISRERTKFYVFLYSPKFHTRVPSSHFSKTSTSLRIKFRALIIDQQDDP